MSLPRRTQPLAVLTIALVAALLFALWITWRFSGQQRDFLLYYFVPIGIPFVAFGLDRWEQRPVIPLASWSVDLAVLIWALMRAFIPLPLVSGHALFLTYALFTTRSWVARGTAALVLLQVVYLKLSWQDSTLVGGILLGYIAARAFHRCFSSHPG